MNVAVASTRCGCAFVLCCDRGQGVLSRARLLRLLSSTTTTTSLVPSRARRLLPPTDKRTAPYHHTLASHRAICLIVSSPTKTYTSRTHEPRARATSTTTTTTAVRPSLPFLALLHAHTRCFSMQG